MDGRDSAECQNWEKKDIVAMSGMSREITKMDGRDSAECQNWEKKDIVGINGKV